MERAPTGCTVKDVPPAEFVTTYAAYLKRVGTVELPPWVDTIKTASRKELAPYDQDWFYIRIGKSMAPHTRFSFASLRRTAATTANTVTQNMHSLNCPFPAFDCITNLFDFATQPLLHVKFTSGAVSGPVSFGRSTADVNAAV